MKLRTVAAAAWRIVGLCALVGCSRDPIDRLIARLDDLSTREQAIEDLVGAVRRAPAAQLQAVRERVVGALGDAYRTNHARPQIVGALAALRDPLAAEVFVAAIGDADRGGPYFEAAVQAASTLAELECRHAVAPLIAMLERAQRQPQQIDRQGLLRRVVIEALDRLGDARAVPALVAVLQGDPLRQDIELNRRAAAALGSLGEARAAEPLTEMLGGTRHGLLVYEAARRALCALGPKAAPWLVARATQRGPEGRLAEVAPAAAAVLGDLGSLPQLRQLAPRQTDPATYRLAVAETLLRQAPSAPGEELCLAVLDDEDDESDLPGRAAELLGWYGSAAAVPRLAAALDRLARRGDEVDQELDAAPAALRRTVQRRAVALAYARLARRGDEALSTLTPAQGEVVEPGPKLLVVYGSRLALVDRCGEQRSCYLQQLRGRGSEAGSRDASGGDGARGGQTRTRPVPSSNVASGDSWRAQERAALELGRLLDTERLLRSKTSASRRGSRVWLRPAGSAGSSPDEADGGRSSARQAAVTMVAGALSDAFADLHPQARRAALTSLERIAGQLSEEMARRVARILETALESSERWLADEGLASRTFCLARRLLWQHRQRGGPGQNRLADDEAATGQRQQTKEQR